MVELNAESHVALLTISSYLICKNIRVTGRQTVFVIVSIFKLNLNTVLCFIIVT